MTELKIDKPLKRKLPGTNFYLKLYGGHFEICVVGSKRQGVSINWLPLLKTKEAMVPTSAPAKIMNAYDYLQWIEKKRHLQKNMEIKENY